MAHKHAWDEITGKPTKYQPVAHKHSATDITSGVISKSRLPSASTSGPGIVQLATAAEVEAGTSTTAVPSIADVASYVKTTTETALEAALPIFATGTPIAGAAWDGQSQLIMRHTHEVIRLSAITSGRGRGSVRFAAFPHGLLHASVTILAGAEIAVVSHESEETYGSTLERVEMRFWRANGQLAALQALVRVSVLVVGW